MRFFFTLLLRRYLLLFSVLYSLAVTGTLGSTEERHIGEKTIPPSSESKEPTGTNNEFHRKIPSLINGLVSQKENSYILVNDIKIGLEEFSEAIIDDKSHTEEANPVSTIIIKTKLPIKDGEMIQNLFKMKLGHNGSSVSSKFALNRSKYMDLYHGISYHRIRFWDLEPALPTNKNWILCVGGTCYTKKLTGLEGLPLPIYILGVMLNIVSSTVSLVIEQFLNERTRSKTLHLLGISGVIAVVMYILNGLGFPMYFTGLVALFLCIFVIL